MADRGAGRIMSGLHPGRDGRVVAALAPALNIYLVPLEADGFALEHFNEAGITLPPQIVRSAPIRQIEYFYGRLAARRALVQLGLPDAQIGTGPMREPLWPRGVTGSISHTRYLAAAIAAPASAHGAIGIDMETVIGPALRPVLISTAVSPAEMDYLSGLQLEHPMDCLLTLVFSAKESFFKAAFPKVRRYFDFDAVELRAFDGAARTLTFEVREELCNCLREGDVRVVCYDMINADTVCTHCIYGFEQELPVELVWCRV
ncbi:4'-phosphopantetheinyl transferase superfamily protein [Massilia sp. PAMC28688]|uniref:4'-phosphopantetheinyl transferase family protein n=1 Tax=Massilia sp. PAMC28688 TaxID=2861283 RepID=UPI001C625183|nr:4'-phosphopantetheinyl transferase superfamily protein [Massilia sp. PAMC28688]QYF92634.1 4'-phosphopantetheinyl transferase superfamily protein [Massilia sp. PAMC28688]